MENTRLIKINLLTFILLLGVCYCFVVIPERVALHNINQKYLKWGNVSMKRYGRKSPYYINLEGHNIHEWNNNVTIHVLFFEYLHNEYRRSFVEFHMKTCDFLSKNHFIGTIISSYGVPCPAPPRVYRFMNITIPTKGLPQRWPFKKFRALIEGNQTDTNENIFSFSMYARLEDK